AGGSATRSGLRRGPRVRMAPRTPPARRSPSAAAITIRSGTIWPVESADPVERDETRGPCASDALGPHGRSPLLAGLVSGGQFSGGRSDGELGAQHDLLIGLPTGDQVQQHL